MRYSSERKEAVLKKMMPPHTGRLRQRSSDELICGAHSRLAAGPTDVLEALIDS